MHVFSVCIGIGRESEGCFVKTNFSSDSHQLPDKNFQMWTEKATNRVKILTAEIKAVCQSVSLTSGPQRLTDRKRRIQREWTKCKAQLYNAD